MAAPGWCAPTDTPYVIELQVARALTDLELKYGKTLACGCKTQNTLETGWHQTGCMVVGGQLCAS